ncbi:MAG: polysaccharide pyruvyl transferase family protein [Cyanobacteriota bacterium]
MSQTLSLYFWNPKRRRWKGRFGKNLPFYSRPNNFGDLLGPLIVERVLAQRGVTRKIRTTGDPDSANQSLLTVGSILHFAKNGDIIWGSGRNGKISSEEHRFSNLDVRMLRGPLTHVFLAERGVFAPKIFGDPGLLVGYLFPEYLALRNTRIHKITVISNLNDGILNVQPTMLKSPTDSLSSILRRIAQSELVISSSLHGIVVAEAFGVPVRVLKSSAEPSFKYEDYFLGTGRSHYPSYGTVQAAMDGQSPDPPEYSVSEMLAAFPYECFEDTSV